MWKLTHISSVFHKETEQSSGWLLITSLWGCKIRLIPESECFKPLLLSGLTEPSPCDKCGQRLGSLWRTPKTAALKIGMDLGVDGWLSIKRIFVLFMKW